MLDLSDRYNESDFGDHNVPLFEDVLAVFTLLTSNISEAQELLQIRPVYRKQQENFDRVLKCITHLIYLLLKTAKTVQEKRLVFTSVQGIVRANIRSACTNDTLLHLCVSRLNVIKSGYFTDDNNSRVSFRNLTQCGSSDINLTLMYN